MNYFHLLNSQHLYNIIELQRMQNYPIHKTLQFLSKTLENLNHPFFNTFPGSVTKAYITLAERLGRTYKKLPFGIDSCIINKEAIVVEQEVKMKMPFCHLLHFKKVGCKTTLPKLLIFAPMAGHHATLLKGTVQELLPFFDVYITDWIDASRVPMSAGKFDMDDYIDYAIKFIASFGERVHVLAVCQPTVPVLAASAIMSCEKIEPLPASMILMGGPVDARKNQTFPGEFALERNIEWFKNNVITTVPGNYPGSGRKVYPGFLQVSGFISLNLEKHISSYIELFTNIMNNNEEEIKKHTHFYDEYLSTMDLPAEFYLQTIEEVFQDFSLAKGKLKSRGRSVNLDSITNIPLLGVEGEKDDIAAVGQTRAALDLCKNIPSSKKQYYLQLGVGHYGIFSGSKFREHIVPVIKDFAYKYSSPQSKKTVVASTDMNNLASMDVLKIKARAKTTKTSYLTSSAKANSKIPTQFKASKPQKLKNSSSKKAKNE
ncbi:MAG: polyhydroxyalkanoate depolymerase [Alphaproteobacteria bacterium]|nr:polyhydroxyalkanoate depolymerase [Alphaproteobacteria bacterium]